LRRRGRKSDFLKLPSVKLSDVLDTKRKKIKAKNILTNMRREGMMERVGGNKRTGCRVLTIDYVNPVK
jgi:hypothetical protein